METVQRGRERDSLTPQYALKANCKLPVATAATSGGEALAQTLTRTPL
jgi:hypothetical protein